MMMVMVMINCLDLTVYQELWCMIIFNTYNLQDKYYYSHFTNEETLK